MDANAPSRGAGSAVRQGTPAGAGGPAPVQPPPRPLPQPRAAICPYCGHLSLNTHQCDRCKGLLDPLSRQASQNAMGPWFIRDEANPFRPGCSFDTLGQLVMRGRVTRDSVLRGPTTRQFWTSARNTPGVANLLGECHACHASVSPRDTACPSCAAVFPAATDRQHLGLAPVHLLPGHAAPDAIAATAVSSMRRMGTSGTRPGAHSAASTGSAPGEAGAFTMSHGDAAEVFGQGAGLDSPVSSAARRSLSAAAVVLAILCLLLVAALVIVIAGPGLGLEIPALDRLVGRGPAPAPVSPTGETRPSGGATPAPAETPAAVPPPSPSAPSSPPPEAHVPATPESAAAAVHARALVLIASDRPESLTEALGLLVQSEHIPALRAGVQGAQRYCGQRLEQLRLMTGL